MSAPFLFRSSKTKLRSLGSLLCKENYPQLRFLIVWPRLPWWCTSDLNKVFVSLTEKSGTKRFLKHPFRCLNQFNAPIKAISDLLHHLLFFANQPQQLSVASIRHCSEHMACWQMALKEAWCKLSGLEKEVGTDDPDHLKAARALSALGSWLGSNYAEVGQCIRCFKRSRGGLSRYPIHPTHIDTSPSAQRQDETQQPELNVGICWHTLCRFGRRFIYLGAAPRHICNYYKQPRFRQDEARV